jgi:hypothetical protein
LGREVRRWERVWQPEFSIGRPWPPGVGRNSGRPRRSCLAND